MYGNNYGGYGGDCCYDPCGGYGYGGHVGTVAAEEVSR